MKRYYMQSGYGSLFEMKEFLREDEMLECVRQHFVLYDRMPTVYYGERLEFEPAEIIKSWKVKGNYK